MTPEKFKKIKNYLFSDRCLNEYSRWYGLLDVSWSELWQKAGEQPPRLDSKQLANRKDKIKLFFDYMAQQQSPQRFVDLCQVVVGHILEVQLKDKTLERGDIAGIFVADINRAFAEFGALDTLIIDQYDEFERKKYRLQYHGPPIYDPVEKLTPQELRQEILGCLYQKRTEAFVMINELAACFARKVSYRFTRKDVDAELQYLNDEGYVKLGHPGNDNYHSAKITSKGIKEVETNGGEPVKTIDSSSNITVHNTSGIVQIAQGSKGTNQSTKSQENSWFWWVMSIVGGILVLLVGAYVFGVGK